MCASFQAVIRRLQEFERLWQMWMNYLHESLLRRLPAAKECAATFSPSIPLVGNGIIKRVSSLGLEAAARRPTAMINVAGDSSLCGVERENEERCEDDEVRKYEEMKTAGIEGFADVDYQSLLRRLPAAKSAATAVSSSSSGMESSEECLSWFGSAGDDDDDKRAATEGERDVVLLPFSHASSVAFITTNPLPLLRIALFIISVYKYVEC
nr:hypothetical protein Iba_chr05cCG4620 [Ipomoea batatas]